MILEPANMISYCSHDYGVFYGTIDFKIRRLSQCKLMSP